MLLLSQLQCTTCFRHCRRQGNLLLSISFEGSFCHFEKRFFHTQSFDRTRFVKHHIIVFFGPLLPLCGGHYTIGLLIKFVADTDEGERLWISWASILIETVPPSRKRVETLGIRDVINECAAIGTAIEGVTKGLEFFLTSSIPNL